MSVISDSNLSGKCPSNPNSGSLTDTAEIQPIINLVGKFLRKPTFLEHSFSNTSWMQLYLTLLDQLALKI